MTDTRVFLSASAQEENLGDLILRRTMLRWLDDPPLEVNLYVGSMPAQYVAALQSGQARRYTNNREWTVALLKSLTRRGRTVLLFSPGQQGLVLRKLEVVHASINILLAIAVRVRGGLVIKVGRSLEGPSRAMLLLERILARLCNVYVLRDRTSARKIAARTEVVPDLAVGATERVTERVRPRRFVAFSWRHDREVPIALMENSIAYARRRGLQPILVTQVWKDNDVHARLATQFDIAHLEWTDRDHGRQLDRVLDVYEETEVILSNRLHALILGWNSGVLPLGYSSPSDAKIWNHLEELGLDQSVVRDSDAARLDDLLSSGDLAKAARQRYTIATGSVARLQRQVSVRIRQGT